MTTPATFAFKPPPVVECMSREHCLGFGKKVFVPDIICNSCLRRHDPQRLREWAQGNTGALSILDEEFHRKQQTKRNLEARGRYLCAFEDPDFTHCRWRRYDLNLRGTRTDCGIVKRKGTACAKCWRRHLEKINIIQYFTPMGMCREELDKATEYAEAEALEGDEAGNLEDDDDLVDLLL
jgi:hypothetical protein